MSQRKDKAEGSVIGLSKKMSKGFDGKGAMVKSRWIGWRGQSNLISSALSQSIHTPGHLSRYTQRTHSVGQLKDLVEITLPCVTSQANIQRKGT